MEEFIPALIEQTIDEVEYQLLEKPTRMGGIGITDPIEASKHAFNTSVKATKMLSDAIISCGKIEIDIYEESLR